LHLHAFGALDCKNVSWSVDRQRNKHAVVLKIKTKSEQPHK